MAYFYGSLIVLGVLFGLPQSAQSQYLILEEPMNEYVQDVQSFAPCNGVGSFSRDCSPLSISDSDDNTSCQEYYEVFGNGKWVIHEDTCTYNSSYSGR